MAASANTALTLHLGYEKKCAELESQLSEKNKALDSAAEKLRTAEENVALVVAEKDKQSSTLQSYQRANEDLKVQLRDLDRRLKETESKHRASVKYHESVEYTTKVVDAFRTSSEYDDELYRKCSGFFDRGCAHVLRQFHHLVPDKALLCRVFEGSYTNPDFRSGCDFVPFTDSELAEIEESDRKAGRQWTPPAPVHPNLLELCDQYAELPEESEPLQVEPLTTLEPPSETEAAESGPALVEEVPPSEGTSAEAAPPSSEVPTHVID